MKIRKSLTLIVCLLFIMTSCGMTGSAVVLKKTQDWSDGVFTGTWEIRNTGVSGDLTGTLNQGRQPAQGSFAGEWNSSDGIFHGQMQGVFRNHILIGSWQNASTGKKAVILGVITMSDTGFSGRLRSPGNGVIEISGEYAASFLPALTGEYGVGVRSLHLIDDSRYENLSNDTDDYREMMVQVWYPIENESLGEQGLYMDPLTFLWLKGRSPIPLFTIPDDAYLFVRPHERTGASIAAGMFPVVIFSPGYDGVYQIYSSFIEDLVSRGFVVVSINHPYVSGITVFPDNRTVGLAPVPTDPAGQQAFFAKALRVIVQDAKFVLNTTVEMNESDPEFAGHFDCGRVGMYGHSFGGANTAVCCYEDSRFKAGMTLEGVFYPDFIPGNVSTPFLMMTAEARYLNDSSVQYMWDHVTADTYEVGVLGSTHYAYTDVGILLSHLVPLIPAKVLGFGSIPPKRMVNVTRTFVDAFFEVYLKGAPREKLLFLSEMFPEVEITYKVH